MSSLLLVELFLDEGCLGRFQVGPWLLRMTSFCRLVMGERSTPLADGQCFFRCGCPVFSVVTIFLMPAVRQSFVLPQRNDRGVVRSLDPSSLVVDRHHQLVSGSRRTELTRSCQGPPLKNEWQKVGSNSGPTAPEARTLPILHAPLPL